MGDVDQQLENGIGFLLKLKRKRMKSIGLAHSDMVDGPDALATVVNDRSIAKRSKPTPGTEDISRRGAGESFLDNIKRKRDDDVSKFVRRVRQAVNDDSIEPDFVIESSDDDSITFKLNTPIKGDDGSIKSEESVTVKIGKDEVVEVDSTFTFTPDIPSPAESVTTDEKTIFSVAESTTSTTSTSKLNDINKGHVRRIFLQDVNEVIVEKKVVIQIPRDILESYAEKKIKGAEVAKNAAEVAAAAASDAESDVTQRVTTMSGREATSFLASKVPQANRLCDISKKKSITAKKRTASAKEATVMVDSAECNDDPIPVADLQNYLINTYGDDDIIFYTDTDRGLMTTLVEKSMMIAEFYKQDNKGGIKIKDQLELYEKLTKEDRDFFTISDKEMNDYFKGIMDLLQVKSGINEPSRIDNWRKYMKLHPRSVVKTGDYSKSLGGMKDLMYTEGYQNLIGFVDLINRIKVLAMLQMLPISNEAYSIATSLESPGSGPKPKDDEDEEVTGYCPVPFPRDIEESDEGWFKMGNMSQLTDDGMYDDISSDELELGGGSTTTKGKTSAKVTNSRGNKKNKFRTKSQKSGGFIKSILKKISTCGCKKKTRRRVRKNITIRKGKKRGGKHTYRNKVKGNVVKRVRFTMKSDKQ